MRKRILVPVAAVLTPVATLGVLLALLSGTNLDPLGMALAAPAAPGVTITDISPNSGPNDLDTAIVITGTDFTDSPTVTLGTTALDDIGWTSATRLTATVPWGMAPGVYKLTVTSPGGSSASLTEAFTVVEAIGKWNAGELYGGDVRRIYMNPVTPTTLYVTPHDIGLFRSRDGGAHWTFLSVSLDRQLAIDPENPRTVYAYGMPPRRSDDEGETWHDIPATFPNSPTLGGGCQSNVELYPHPETVGRVYATSCGGPFKGSGVLSSTNQGEDWEEAMEGLTDTQVTSLAFYPGQPLTMYVGTANGNVFISHDGGAQWSFASQPVEYVGQLAVNPFEPHEVWVSSDIDWGASEALLKSTNAELTAWTSVLPESEDVGWWGSEYANIIFPPALGWGQSYSRTVLVASMGETGGYVTTDSGDSWTSFGPSQTHTANDFALHPSDPDIIYMAHSQGQGVYKTTNGTADDGGDWQVSNHGLTAVKIGQLETIPGEPSVVYGQASSPGIYKATQGGQTWDFLPIQEGGPSYILVDPITTTRLYAGSYAGIHISEDEGQNWTFVEIEPPDIYTDCKLFVEALAAHRAQTGTILAGIWHDCGSYHRGSVYRSGDYGEHWTRMDVVTPGQEISRVVEIAYDPVSPTIVYAGVEPGVQGANGIHRSEDGGLTWERVGEQTPLFGAAGDIAFERTPPYRVFASTGLPSSNGGLYYSEDHGRTPWVQIDPPGSYPHVGPIAVAPSVEGDTSVLYAVGEFDGGLHRLPLTSGTQLTSTILPWTPAAGELGQVPVYSLAWVTGTERVFLYAGTTGGRVDDTGTQAQGLSVLAATAEDGLISPGVYRYTTWRPKRVYLPVVLRAHW